MTSHDALQKLICAAGKNMLAHAIVFAGPVRGEGEELAESLIQWLVCRTGETPGPCLKCAVCRQIREHTWADACWIEAERKSRQIDIDSIRDLIQRLSRTSLAGSWKVGILRDAERMTPQASNALLKTLEEPSAQTLLLLLTEQPQALLPTIASRCQKITLGRSTGELPEPQRTAFNDWLRENYATGGPVEAMARAGSLAALLDDLKKQIESAVKEENDQAGEECGKSAENTQLEARIESRYRQARSIVLEKMLLWHRDVLVLQTGGDQSLLHFPDLLELLRERASKLSRARAIEAVEMVERAGSLLNRSLPEYSVFSYTIDRMDFS